MKFIKPTTGKSGTQLTSEGGARGAPPESPPEAPPEDPSEGAGSSNIYIIWLDFIS